MRVLLLSTPKIYFEISNNISKFVRGNASVFTGPYFGGQVRHALDTFTIGAALPVWDVKRFELISSFMGGWKVQQRWAYPLISFKYECEMR